MSFVHRSACLALTTLLAAASGACGDNNAARNDDGDDGGGTLPDGAGGGGELDASVQPDAAGSDIDASPGLDAGDVDGGGDEDAGTRPDGGDIDAGGKPDGGELDAGAPDAGSDPLDGEFLLSLEAAQLPGVPVRFITTVDFTGSEEGGTADFTFQPIIREACAAGMGGLPVGEPFTTPGIAVDGKGAFQIVIADVTLPALASPLGCAEVTADSIEVSGTVQSPDLSCGDVTVTIGTGELLGTFGAIRIEPGTVGDANLPEPVTACP